MHLSIGQEATAVGACWPLRPADVITSTHRGHGHCLAKGLDPLGMFAELMGKDQGTNRGRGGSMHIADPRLGIFGANGIVAAGLPIAVGAATAAQLRADGERRGGILRRRRAGPGRVPRGAEPRRGVAAAGGLLLREQRLRRVLAGLSPACGVAGAAGRRATASATSRSTATTSWRRPRHGGCRARRARRGGPAVVEAATYRWHGHYEGDPERYRSPEEVRRPEARDPLLVHEARLREAGVGDDEIKALESSIADELDEAVEAARRSRARPRPR